MLIRSEGRIETPCNFYFYLPNKRKTTQTFPHPLKPHCAVVILKKKLGDKRCNATNEKKTKNQRSDHLHAPNQEKRPQTTHTSFFPHRNLPF